MTVAPAEALGINLLLFAESDQDSAAQIAPHVVGDYRDLEALKDFAKQCDFVTFEHELVPIAVIKGLEAAGVKVLPTSDSFQYSQNKALMRQRLTEYPAPKWKVINDGDDLLDFPFIAKSISGGYDGRGVWKIKNHDDLDEVLNEIPQLLIEELVEFDFEIAVMVARSAHGQAVTWAPTQTVQSDGICTSTISPAPKLSLDLAEKAQHLALSIANDLALIGVMAVEMFVKGEQLFINELAMRPHNSGHWTIEGAKTSQFEQHLRAILDLPLGDPSMVAPYAVMGNILGGDKTDMFRPYLHLMARNPDLKFHQYKKEIRKGRKVGHVTVVGENLLELTEVIAHARDYMSGEIDE
ncbi:5-(carboxyamino)imidazole ribonucleotide synthase [Candidatus Planktophila lacus]|nr:5-(carboxyamino)imidazole ribonucleotide synthase [Candidatus Planktophila lacus]